MPRHTTLVVLALLVLSAAAAAAQAASRQPRAATKSTAKTSTTPNTTTSSSSKASFLPGFFWPWPDPIAGRCVAPGTSPRLTLSLPAIVAGLEAAKFFGQHPELLFDGYWTNAVNRDITEDALMRLSVMRTGLQAKNLHHAYLPGKLTGNINSPAEVPCGPETLNTRTIDGSCNYPDDPLAGAVNTRFGRNVPLSVVHPDTANLLNPNPLLVSARLLQRAPGVDYPQVPFLNLWAGAWVQFMVHDWFVHGSPDNSRTVSIPMPAEHSLGKVAGSMVVGYTRPDLSRTAEEAAANLPPTSLNLGTHWWDASQVYGSDAATSARLREGVGGRMKVTEAGLLPLSARGFGDAGVTQNWWLGLELLHTLFVKEHNAIATALSAAYPDMTDQQLFDKARMINAAVLAKLHSIEWTPAILPNNNLAVAMNVNWSGMLSMLSPLEAAAAEALVPTLSPQAKEPMYGYRRGERLDAGVPYSMTEEFTSVYRMHMLLPESFTVRRADGSSDGTLWSGQTFLAGARKVMEKHSLLDLATTFGVTLPGALTLHNYPIFMTNISLPDNLGPLDLAAVDILRDRERGVPRYNKFRQLLQLRPLSSIDDITPDPAAREALKSVYGNDIELVDLMPGVLAEARRPDCFGFGETQFQVFLLMDSRRLAADRFFTSDYTAASYTQVGLDWIEAATFKSVLLRSIPELQALARGIPDNAFNPWTLPAQP